MIEPLVALYGCIAALKVSSSLSISLAVHFEASTARWMASPSTRAGGETVVGWGKAAPHYLGRSESKHWAEPLELGKLHPRDSPRASAPELSTASSRPRGRGSLAGPRWPCRMGTAHAGRSPRASAAFLHRRCKQECPVKRREGLLCALHAHTNAPCRASLLRRTRMVLATGEGPDRDGAVLSPKGGGARRIARVCQLVVLVVFERV